MQPRPPWLVIGALSATVSVAFGTLFYAYAVLITRSAAGADFSTTTLSVAYQGFVLVGGLLAYPVGRWADRHGVRGIFAVGVAAGVAALLGLSAATTPFQVILIGWVLFGIAGAAALYEPAFVAVDQWFSARRRRGAMAALVVIGGLAGPIFIPLTGALVETLGWRPAARILAGILAVVGFVTVAFVLPAGPARRPEPRPFSAAVLLRDPRFVWFGVSVVLMFGGLQVMYLHRIKIFEDAGFSVTALAAWAGLAGFLGFPGRGLAPYVATRVSPARLHAAVGVVHAAAAAAALGSRVGHVAAHMVLFGLVAGPWASIRALAMGEWYSGANFGRVLGAQWTAAAVIGSVFPALVGVWRDRAGSYHAALVVVAAVFLVAALCAVVADRSGRRIPGDGADRRGLG